ncbi:MAG: TSUP family transporter [Porticoccaceae bacterium]|jgi:hypothetical protein|nr:TSUP family transporter [Porticoccaceae bacterium]MBT7567160.1 TSUP family transporter [Porticoccaceae bacterium]
MELYWYQYALIAIVFIWSGFVRSGLGFGGALFTIPFLLLIHDDPLFFLPIISIHLLFFAPSTLVFGKRKATDGQNQPAADANTVNWRFVRFSLAIMFIPKLVGVVGLIVLPTELMNSIIFFLIAGYSMTYILGRPLQSSSLTFDIVFLVIGAYISGTSLVGGPMVIAVALRHIKPFQFRDTLFVIWTVLVSIKLAAFVWAGISLNFVAALYLLPFAGIGHFIGLGAHERLLRQDSKKFYRILGSILFCASGAGLYQVLS